MNLTNLFILINFHDAYDAFVLFIFRFLQVNIRISSLSCTICFLFLLFLELQAALVVIRFSVRPSSLTYKITSVCSKFIMFLFISTIYISLFKGVSLYFLFQDVSFQVLFFYLFRFFYILFRSIFLIYIF